MEAYSDRRGLPFFHFENRFRFNGNPLKDRDTPDALKMKDGDTIYAFDHIPCFCELRDDGKNRREKFKSGNV